MKKARRLIWLALAMMLLIRPMDASAETRRPTRVINVVYDDSASMYVRNSDRWCQAKYSMEVFAAMLGPEDTMNVYYMSDFDPFSNGNPDSDPRIVLHGNEGAKMNVGKLHSEKTNATNTPIASVEKALKDLEAANADEKCLVILTDGEFNKNDPNDAMPVDEVDARIAQKSSDVKVIFLRMGAGSKASLTADESKGIFYLEAKNSKDILERVTEISTRVFNTNKLKVSKDNKVSFNVPMSELTVFAQGENVSLKGVKTVDGAPIGGNDAPVQVMYSESDAGNFKDNTPDTSLKGVVCTYRGDFDGGDYQIDVTGAQVVEVYYKPNVDIAIYLTNEEGDLVNDLESLYAGEYTLHFGFVKAGTDEPVEDYSLFGKDVKFDAIVNNNGNTMNCDSGAKLKLQKGELTIDVTAEFLKYNSVSTQLAYTVYQDEKIHFVIVEDPEFVVSEEGLEEGKYILVKASTEGGDLTPEEWEIMELPEIKLSKDGKKLLEEVGIAKTEEPGVFKLWPIIPEKGPTKNGGYEDVKYSIFYNQKVEDSIWTGTLKDQTLKFADTRPTWVKILEIIIKLIILGIILLLILGYMPFIKHYLPKSLKKKPLVRCKSNVLGVKSKDEVGNFEKKLAYTFIPYVAERGTIRFVPRGTSGAPVISVRAIKERRMTITNLGSFFNKPNITFDGNKIEKGMKKFDIGAGVTIQVKTKDWNYTCNPNQAKK